MNEYHVEKLKKEDCEKVLSLLNDADLPADDIYEHLDNFLILKKDAEVIGAVGLEVWNDKGLLRSLVVKNNYRNTGLGKILYEKCIELAKQKNLSEIGLLTTTAEDFFAKRGFMKLTKESIPEFIKRTKEFRIYCPSSSIVMIKKI